MLAKQRAVVICPGRGTYNAQEWGYLTTHHGNKPDLLNLFDQYRRDQGQPSLTELDSETPFSMKTHTRGDHASSLIYGCSIGDFQDINRDQYDIVAITGNSMGWYTSLAAAGALTDLDGLHLVNTMGRLMHENMIGGQLIYPWFDNDWHPQWDARQRYLDLAANFREQGLGETHLSIDLGGMLVFGADTQGLKNLTRELPQQDRFPMRLHNHAAFHTPLQQPVRAIAREQLSKAPFHAPEIPMIDGRGHIWTPWSTDPEALWDYTLGHQLTQAYDFTAAIKVAVREFAPDKLIILGPGTTLGGAVAQSLIVSNWLDMDSKRAFKERQNALQLLCAMGNEEQRGDAVRPG